MENIEEDNIKDDEPKYDYKYLLWDLLQCKEITKEDYDEMLKTYKNHKSFKK